MVLIRTTKPDACAVFKLCSSVVLQNGIRDAIILSFLMPITMQSTLKGKAMMTLTSSTSEGSLQFKTDAESDSSRRSLLAQNAAQKYVADAMAAVYAEASPPATSASWTVTIADRLITITITLTYPSGTKQSDIEASLQKVKDSAAVKNSAKNGASTLTSYGVDDNSIVITGEVTGGDTSAASMVSMSLAGVLALMACVLVA